MEKVKKFNLELALFVKELHSYTNNVNEVDDETTKLLMETIRAVDKLQATSKNRETLHSNEICFVQDMNEDIFECRRHIICRLCHEHIQLNLEDFEIHIQKKSHKEKEAEQKSSRQSPTGNCIVQEIPKGRARSTSSTTNKGFELKPSSSVTSVNSIDVRATSRANGEDSSSSSVVSVKLENIVKTDQVSREIVKEILELTSRNEARFRGEVQIAESLTKFLKTFDSTLKFISFGSSTFGFGGSNTNFNILVNASGLEKSPAIMLHEFEKLMKNSNNQNDFDVLENISGNRVQKKRLQFLHKKSSILCWLQFSSNFELAESNQVIRDCINRDPLCFHLTAYIRSWQNVLNDIVAKETTAFRFNTYIISVLVIFFLQMVNHFPKLKEIPSSDSKYIAVFSKPEQDQLKKAVMGFFEFYGKRYEHKNQLISINIGRWQERWLRSDQKNFTPEQKSLRDAMECNAANWKDCTMYVQDIKSQGINITAEISKEEAQNFKKMCQLFATDISHTKCIDEYLSKVSTLQSANNVNLFNFGLNKSTSAAKKENGSPLISMHSLKTAIETTAVNLSSSANAQPSSFNNLENLIKLEDVSKLARVEMINLLSRSEDLNRDEAEIIKTLSDYFSSPLKVLTFGSVRYGFGSLQTNFNILIKTGSNRFIQSFHIHSFEESLKYSQTFEDFELLGKTTASRVQKQQLKVLHKKSGIVCMLQFDDSSELQRSSQIIYEYTKLSPICKHLIAYVKAWQNVLNNVAEQNGLPMFHFNTYIISVLVIFYLQLNHGFPPVNNLSAMLSGASVTSTSSLGKFVCEFFHFYGHKFEFTNHLISLNVAKWQEKRLQKTQTVFTPQQRSMREAIALNPTNWTTDMMWVQDPVLLGINITSEISKHDANNFIKLCRMFAAYTPKFCDEPQKLRKAVSKEQINPNQAIEKRIDFGITYTKLLDTSKLHLIHRLLNKSVRESFETDITTTLDGYLKLFDSNLKPIRFGSSQYGLNEAGSNFNLFVFIDNEAPIEVVRKLDDHLAKTDIQSHFEGMAKINEYRVLKPQISMIHIKSGIRCFLLFDNDKSIPDSSGIIHRFTEKVPMCHSLIRFIRTWQMILTEMYPNSEIIQFQFNTYIISTLVIFFFQVNFNAPVIENIWSIPPLASNGGDIKVIACKFFSFYGNSYQIWNHVISAHIGRWQERRLQSEQRNFNPAQKRLRNGIESNPASWTNCTMYVQDLVRNDVNIAAEISKKAAENFQQLCQVFAKYLERI